MLDPHQIKLMETAPRLGIGVEDLSTAWGLDIVAYHKDGRSVHVVRGRVYPNLTVRASMIADHKIACKKLLQDLDIPTAPALLVEDPQRGRAAMETFLAAHQPVVCKPVSGTNGQGVKLGITRMDSLQQHIEGLNGPVMLEAEVQGHDPRLQTMGGKLIAACVRIPTTLVGDGISPVEQLIEKRNDEIALQNRQNHVDLDEETVAFCANGA